MQADAPGRQTAQDAGSGAEAAAQVAAPDPSEVRIWGTKGIHFWALLGAVLVKARPESILELGGGRSTTFLADYAFRARVPCVSIEQSEAWYRKIAADLRFMNVRGQHVHHVPVTRAGDGERWYDLAAVERLVGGRAFDLVFVDGPQGGARRSARGQALVPRAARDARLVVVDDVHRPYNLAFFEDLARRFPPNGRFFLSYGYGSNLLAMATAEWRGVVRSSLRFLDLPVLHGPPARDEREESDDEQEESDDE